MFERTTSKVQEDHCFECGKPWMAITFTSYGAAIRRCYHCWLKVYKRRTA